MIGQVKTINGTKQIVPLSGETVIDSVTQGSMSAVTSNAVAIALQNTSSNYVFATMNDYTQHASEVSNGSLVIIENENDYLIGENQ